MISHENIMHHSACISQAWGYTQESIAATWMPYFHDYGLVDGLIQPLYQGIPCYVLSPLTFIKRPIRWLQAISRYKVTHSQGPNFAYDYCVRRSTLQQRSDLDLSSWCTASNGAEPIRKETLERFIEAFEPYGFRRSALYPAYGLAEATLLVSTKRHEEIPVFCTVESAALTQNRIVEADEHQQGVQTLVSCGTPVSGMNVVIAHPETLHECAPGEVGEIWVSDKSVAQGYWQRSEATEVTFRAYLANTGDNQTGQNGEPFLRTGDLGFLKDGELFVTGRLKDLIVIRGRNHYPQDIELTVVQSHSALRADCGAAFSVDVAGDERLVIAQEIERNNRQLDMDEVVEAIREAVAEHHELEIHAILLLKTGTLPKTSSGKIQRHACRTGFLKGSLDVVETWSADTAEKTKPQMPVPEVSQTAIHTSNGSHITHIDLAVKPVEIAAGADGSRNRADEVIGWLRSYASDRINSRLIDERRCIPPYVVLDFGNRGILGMQVSEQLGGLGLGNRDAMRVVEQLAAIDVSLATFTVVNNFLGIRPIQRYGSQTLRDELLPILAQGRELAAFALTEPGAGSNPRSLSATGVASATGGWRLRGTKIWSGSASWAGVINVFVKLIDANSQSGGITGFAVRSGTRGLRHGPEALTMGMRGMVQNSIHLEDVPVDSGNLLGNVGTGMDAAQDAMIFTRLAIGAMSVGGMKRCLQLMHRYATRRSIATGSLIDNPVTLARLSDLTAATTALETLVARISELLDQGCSVPVEAFIACKTSGPEFLWKAVDSLVQLLGGRGYIETNIAPQLLRDARIFRIFEGPTETLNMFLGSRLLHQGAELHQFLCNELGATAVSDRLREAVEQINARWSEPTVAFSDRPSALRWASLLIGEVATYAILWAALQQVVSRTSPERVHRAIEWVRQQFEQTLKKALADAPSKSVLLSANDATDLISSYAETIGDLEQTLPGEDNELDEFLRRQPTATSPNGNTNSSGSVTSEIKFSTPDSRSDHTPEFIESTALMSSAAKPIGAVEQTFVSIDPILDEPLSGGISTAKSSQNSNLQQAIKTDVKSSAVDSSSPNHAAESIETWLAEWIAKELKIELAAIDTRKSFFNYGLDSVMTVSLAVDIEDWLGRQIPITLAWDYPSIKALAQHLAKDGDVAVSAPRESLVPLQLDGDKPPLFCIYGILLYNDLARNLGKERPVYGVYLQEEVDLLKSGKLEDQQTALTSVAGMAARYLKEIRTLQPVGPYFLAGESFGGLVAFEMAQQLRSQGEKVGLLALFDTEAPGSLKELSRTERVGLHLKNFVQKGPTYALEKVAPKIDSSKKQLLSIINKNQDKVDQQSDRTTQRYLTEVATLDIRQQIREQAASNYVPHPYPGKVALFRAMERSGFEVYSDSQWGWGSLAAGGLEVYHVPGDHIGILKEPHVGVLATNLRACLERAQADD
jgi:alkylation response protein AidB-like acyl-CoA dehydrogenase/acyl-CoA synthetase (AMP-forming)/AMP-acid ligase II/thioesterase domain-containing protein/acyl carrier protein